MALCPRPVLLGFGIELVRIAPAGAGSSDPTPAGRACRPAPDEVSCAREVRTRMAATHDSTRLATRRRLLRAGALGGAALAAACAPGGTSPAPGAQKGPPVEISFNSW